MEIRSMGIDGILCVMGDRVSEEVSAAVYSLKSRVEAAGLPGLRECVPGFADLLIRFDPMIQDAGRMEKRIRGLAAAGAAESRAESRTVEIPVCYGGAYGPDLEEVARHTGLTPEEVIRLHTAPVYRIYMLGFLPGFPYLGGLDERLFTPRRESPRTAIPAGSVGIGGQQTGIYPLESPGGWQLIGRTPLKLFDPGRPLPFRAGEHIRFVPIGEEEFRNGD